MNRKFINFKSAPSPGVGTLVTTEHPLYIMTEQDIINVINKVEGIGGMTVNERLFVCGLMDEFDKARIHDKEKAKKILELLGVDKFSIEQIVK